MILQRCLFLNCIFFLYLRVLVESKIGFLCFTLVLIVFCGTTVSDVAGEVVETGPEVKNLKAGDKVVAMLSIFVSVIS